MLFSILFQVSHKIIHQKYALDRQLVYFDGKSIKAILFSEILAKI